MLARVAKVRPLAVLFLAAAIGWGAGYLAFEGGCVMVLICGVMGPYLACRVGGRCEVVAGPLVNFVMFASPVCRNYLQWLDEGADPRGAFGRGLDGFVLIALFFMAVGFFIGYAVRDGRRRSAGRTA